MTENSFLCAADLITITILKMAKTLRPQLLVRKIHKWVGFILGIQILLWFGSGFLMSFMPIEEVRGDHLLKPQTVAPVNLEAVNLAKLKQRFNTPIESIEIKSWLGQTVAVVKTKQRTSMLSTPSMQLLTPFNESYIERILTESLKDTHKIISIQRLMHAPNEVRGRQTPLWQIQLDDPENTRVYISESNGEIVAKRTDRWRLFDFMWMLHIMDYDEREDFNHPLLYITALSALLFTLTGFVLLFYSLRRKIKTP